MTQDPFLLVSLEESESRDLAKVISNKTARKILDFLSKVESTTESDLAKKMKLPLSTVHYNLQALLKANLVKAEEFHYSKKGKEVLHYSLANKLIIIAPKKTNRETFMEKLKSIIPIGIIALVTAGVIKLVTKFKFGVAKTFAAAPLAAPVADSFARGVAGGGVVEEAAPVIPGLVAESSGVMKAALPTVADASEAAVNNISNITQNISEKVEPVIRNIIERVEVPVSVPSEPSIASWFLMGAAFVIVLLIIWYWFVTRKKVKKK